MNNILNSLSGTLRPLLHKPDSPIAVIVILDLGVSAGGFGSGKRITLIREIGTRATPWP